MLKGIDPVISPEMIKVLMEMGHGDELVIADGNFPAASLAQHLICSAGNGTVKLLDAILKIFPLDRSVDHPVGLMAIPPGDNYAPVVWEDYRNVVKKYETTFSDFEYIERYSFYERTQKAYAVIATSELSLYANLILKKGVVMG